MHDASLWAAWYLLLLAVPLCIVGSYLRDRLAHRRTGRRRR